VYRVFERKLCPPRRRSVLLNNPRVDRRSTRFLKRWEGRGSRSSTRPRLRLRWDRANDSAVGAALGDPVGAEPSAQAADQGAQATCDDAEAGLEQNLKLLRFDRDDEAQEKSLFAIGNLCFQRMDYPKAARRLEAGVEDVELVDGRFGVLGVPGSGVSWRELASSGALVAEEEFFQSDQTYPFGSHVAMVEVDIGTGEAKLVRYVALDDCGTILNPMLVAGQIHGGVAQGAAVGGGRGGRRRTAAGAGRQTAVWAPYPPATAAPAGRCGPARCRHRPGSRVPPGARPR